MATLTEHYQQMPKVSIVICSTPRSGSNFLCDFIARAGVLGRPAEFLSSKHPLHASSNRSEFIDGMLAQGTSPNGVFACKLFWHQLSEYAARFDGRGPVDIAAAARIISAMFPNPKFVLLTRADKLRQAISYWRAIVTDAWWRTTSQPSPPVHDIDHEQILRLRLLLETWDRNWAKFFRRNGFPFLAIAYEDLVETIDERVRSIASLAGTSPPSGGSGGPLFQRQSDDQTDEIIKRHESWLAERWQSSE